MSWRSPRTWIEFALVLTIFFIVGGAPAPHVNESHYLTKAKHYWDPSYCPGDFFLDSADPHVTFYWMFGWITQFVSLTATAWIGRVLAWSLLALGWLTLARTVTTVPWMASLAVALWLLLVEWNNFAGEWVVGGIEAKCFAYGLVLFGLAALARGEWRTPWLWFGAASAFHVLVGAWAVAAAMVVWLWEPRGARLALRSMLPALVLGGVLSLPGLLPALALERGASAEDVTAAAKIYVFDRLPHHLAPLSLPARELRTRFTRFAPVALVLIGMWFWLAARKWRRGARAAALDDDAARGGARRRLIHFAVVALAASAMGLLLEWLLRQNRDAAARVLRYYWFRQADVVVPMAVALLGVSALSDAWRREVGDKDASPKRWIAGVAVGGVIVLCSWFLSSMVISRIEQPRPPAVAQLVRGVGPMRYLDWEDACRWISRHTPPDAVFLTPRAGHSFKWYAARADVANQKDVPQDAASVVQWKRRCQELFPAVKGVSGKPSTLNSPDLWGAKRIRELSEKYGATHVIARTYPPLDLPILYPRGDKRLESYFTVYEIPQEPPADAR